jgi:hypothetical protein
MKIGTSLSRCVRDIFEKQVDFDDVLVIIARTEFDPENDAQWRKIWNGYSGKNTAFFSSVSKWSQYAHCEQEFRDICVRLKREGKLHQPRQYGAWPKKTTQYWYDTILTDDIVNSNPAAKRAWENYKTIAGLS